jgi:hypothetical protein
MTGRRLLEGGCLALGFALATWYGGWWAIPGLAAVWQLIRRKEPAWLPALAASAAWAALLLLLPLGPLDRLDSRLSRLFFLPPLGATGMTLAFAGLVAWGAARVVAGLWAWKAPDQ